MPIARSSSLENKGKDQLIVPPAGLKLNLPCTVKVRPSGTLLPWSYAPGVAKASGVAVPNGLTISLVRFSASNARGQEH